MTTIGWVPVWLAEIADFDPNLRTAVPFIPLSLVLAVLFNRSGIRRPARFAFICCFGLVGVAELGQIVLPARTADWRDVGWGLIGTLLGLAIRQILPFRYRFPRYLMIPEKNDMADWIVCQIGAREHYTVPRALNKAGRLDLLLTDIWNQPQGPIGNLIGKGRMFHRWHPDLSPATVWAPNSSSLIFESLFRAKRSGSSWKTMIGRNRRFQRQCLRFLKEWERANPRATRTVFAFSYAALEIFKFAKSRGWTTVLGQIDPGPHEEMLVGLEHQRYPDIGSSWRPAPPEYWANWKQEIALADRIIVNSRWAMDGLVAAGVDAAKIEIIPLVYDVEDKLPPSRLPAKDHRVCEPAHGDGAEGNGPLQLLFLGNVCLRKGIGRLIEAMRMLQDEPVELKICGPLSVSPALWADLPKVSWTEAVQNAEIRATYEAADVFILPTISDGFARTQLEALASGTPVIATRHCGDVVVDGTNGFLLQENSPEEIAGLLHSIARDRKRLLACDTGALPPGSPRNLDELALRLIGKG